MKVGDADYSFWAFCKLCDLREEMCPEDSEKLDELIQAWYAKDMHIVSGLHTAFFHVYDIESWWKYRTATLSEISALMGITAGILDQTRQLFKLDDLSGDGKEDEV